MDRKWWIIAIVALVIVCLCACAAFVALGGLALFSWNRVVVTEEAPFPFPQEATVEIEPLPATDIPGGPTQPEAEPTPGSPSGQVQPTLEPAAPGTADETLNILKSETIPENDPRDLALRLEGKEGVPETVEGTPPVLDVGAKDTFWAMNVDTTQQMEVDATLAYATPHLYFWIEDGVRYNESDVQRIAETFENDIYPTNRTFFGSEWTPGVDNDPHLYVLYAGGLGSTIGGYYSSGDEFHPDASEFSNAHEMFVINSDNVSLRGDEFLGVMAHEFQHMIHWYTDRNEEGWINEGFAELAQHLNGYDVGGATYLFASDPDLQLNTWPSSPASIPHYGASFMFLSYFLDRFGSEATQALVAHPDNGMDSIDTVLETVNGVDPATGEPVRADDLFVDWTVTNLLNDEDAGDGRYVYREYRDAPSITPTEEIGSCSNDWQTRTVNQYAADYLRITCGGSYTMYFEGTTQVGVLGADGDASNYAFWSNRGDESDMALTREFDFSDVTGPLEMTYRAWYDLEADYDYLYLLVSEDGQQWEIVQTPSGTDADPSGNSYGWAYNGQTGEWIEETVDLSAWAGKQVQVRFEYITDAQVNGEGFLLDDVQIPAIDYAEDFQDDEGGWEANGFVRIQNRLPQTYRVTVIRNGEEVEKVTLDQNQAGSFTFDLGWNDDVVVIVSGTARFTTQLAPYRFRFEE